MLSPAFAKCKGLAEHHSRGSLTVGDPTHKLSEHIRLIFKRGGFGLVVLRGNTPDYEESSAKFERLKHRFDRRPLDPPFPDASGPDPP